MGVHGARTLSRDSRMTGGRTEPPQRDRTTLVASISSVVGVWSSEKRVTRSGRSVTSTSPWATPGRADASAASTRLVCGHVEQSSVENCSRVAARPHPATASEPSDSGTMTSPVERADVRPRVARQARPSAVERMTSPETAPRGSSMSMPPR